MKKLLCLLLAVLMLFSLCACGDSAAEDEGPTTLSAEQKPKTQVAKPLTWDDVNSIPIANSSMTEEELRQICLDFMRMQLSFTWTPKAEAILMNKNTAVPLTPPMVYKGLPYKGGGEGGNGLGNIYTAMHYYDTDNGMMDLSGPNAVAAISNQCSSSVFWCWARVSNSHNYQYTVYGTQAYGCLRVGPYTYDDSVKTFNHKTTQVICEENGEQTMFESYAACKPADGLVNYKNDAGHMRMVVKVDVVRNANGTIDGKNSKLVFMDQFTPYRDYKQDNGGGYCKVTGYIDREISFKELYDSSYLPFTMEELNDPSKVEKAEATIDLSGEKVTVDQLVKAKVKANYSISDITITVKNSKGKQVYTYLFPVYTVHTIPAYEAGVIGAVVQEDLAKYENGKYTIEVSTRLGTGEKPVVYSGKLVKG